VKSGRLPGQPDSQNVARNCRKTAEL